MQKMSRYIYCFVSHLYMTYARSSTGIHKIDWFEGHSRHTHRLFCRTVPYTPFLSSLISPLFSFHFSLDQLLFLLFPSLLPSFRLGIISVHQGVSNLTTTVKAVCMYVSYASQGHASHPFCPVPCSAVQTHEISVSHGRRRRRAFSSSSSYPFSGVLSLSLTVSLYLLFLLFPALLSACLLCYHAQTSPPAVS
ncbi:hypothetical protein F4778DRAFT_82542 [Xylariomycetidae sp. FL2044]|nr:hypothetical protein F4778DRAFT_82542 [Xylariomycetidae sp. FL2044]